MIWPIKKKPAFGLGYKRDVILSSDARYATPPMSAGLHSVDLRPHVPEILNQGPTSACVGFSFAAAIAITESLAGLPYVPVSPRALYFNGRALHGGERRDEGTYLRSVAEAMRRVGAATEGTCPSSAKLINEHPPAAAYMEGYNHRDCRFERLGETGRNLVNQAWAALCAGQPVVIGLGATQAFMDASAKRRLIPAPHGAPIIGGHAVCLVGRDADGFCFQNSWGPGWGENGFAWLEDEWFDDPHTAEVVVLRDWNSVRPGHTEAA